MSSNSNGIVVDALLSRISEAKDVVAATSGSSSESSVFLEVVEGNVVVVAGVSAVVEESKAVDSVSTLGPKEGVDARSISVLECEPSWRTLRIAWEISGELSVLLVEFAVVLLVEVEVVVLLVGEEVLDELLLEVDPVVELPLVLVAELVVDVVDDEDKRVLEVAAVVLVLGSAVGREVFGSSCKKNSC